MLRVGIAWQKWRIFLINATAMALVFTVGPLQADQTARFEVASVKAAPPTASGMPRITGGPGTDSPGQYTARNAPLSSLLTAAYGLRAWELIAPDWVRQARFDITATIPRGATKAQVNEMLLNLLVERFGLAVHKETRALPGYELAVGSGEPRIRNAPAGPDPDQFSGATIATGRLSKDKDGWPELPADAKGIAAAMADRRIRYMFRAQPISQLISLLQRNMASPVIDKSALDGRYDFDLTINLEASVPTPADAGGPTAARDPLLGIVDAVGALGFKVRPVKAPTEVIVVDRINKTPTEN